MNRAVERRGDIIERLADHMLAHGLVASSLRQLARAAQTSDRMLLYYYRDKQAIVTATMECISARLLAVLAGQAASHPLPLAQLRARLAEIVLAPDLWPFMRLFLEIASRAAQGDAFYKALGERLGRGFLAWGAAQLDSGDSADAARLLVALEGMMFLKAIGMEDVSAQAI